MWRHTTAQGSSPALDIELLRPPFADGARILSCGLIPTAPDADAWGRRLSRIFFWEIRDFLKIRDRNQRSAFAAVGIKSPLPKPCVRSAEITHSSKDFGPSRHRRSRYYPPQTVRPPRLTPPGSRPGPPRRRAAPRVPAMPSSCTGAAAAGGLGAPAAASWSGGGTAGPAWRASRGGAPPCRPCRGRAGTRRAGSLPAASRGWSAR